jgi:hypothetical protein
VIFLTTQLIICNPKAGEPYQLPNLLDDITLEQALGGVPATLKFSVFKGKSSLLDFQEGNNLSFKVNNIPMFNGFVFTKQRNKDGVINVTAYDQMRYLKNKDTLIYSDKTLNELILMVAEDYKLKIGELAETEYKIPQRNEQNKSLIDIIYYALQETVRNTGNYFVLYDDFGKLMLKNIEDMKLDLLIDSETAEDIDYTSSIDKTTYNQIKLTFDNKETGKREEYISKNSESINDFGVLQYYESSNSNLSLEAKSGKLLELYDQKTRNLTVKNAFGDTRVRAGNSMIVSLDIGDVIVSNYMVVTKVVHKFEKDHYAMDLKLIGHGPRGDFVA